MADKTYYAWSRILGGDKKAVKVGDKVSQSDLGIEDEEWAYLVESGSVRPQKYPVPDGVNKSPVQHLMDEAAKLNSEAYNPNAIEESVEVPEPKGRGW